MKTKPYDASLFLKTDEDIAHYLNDAYDDPDPKVFVLALGDIAKIKGVAMVAERSGLNRESLYKVFSGQSKPQWATIQGIMKALNVQIKAVCS